VQRPGCACAQAELAAAEDFDPLRIRPYVTLDAPEGGTETGSTAGQGAVAGTAAPSGGAGSAGAGSGGPGSYGTDPYGAGAYEPYGSTAAFPAEPHPGGDPSETMPLLLRGIGDVPPPPGHEHGRERGRRRGALVAAVAAVAVAGTAALAAAVLGGGDEPDDRAAVPDVTTSASLNLGVSEAPSPSASSRSPEPTSSSPTARETSASASPSPTSSSPAPTTASPSTSVTTSGAGAPPPASPSSAPPVTPTTTPPGTTPPGLSPGEEGREETLDYGSSGPEVRELQRRLIDVGVYHGRVNGRYDDDVWEAVAVYQSYMYIQGDPEGVYGPNTREVLERYTPHI
ncbi:peptidoglycan-binding domain-containing protein, partial [Streptomyces aureus]|uniref:peptidoglycan-binding domain-containing protein n=1 Tax=Streptomyces aureus TaxID=193461 RepID=UPI0020B1334C